MSISFGLKFEELSHEQLLFLSEMWDWLVTNGYPRSVVEESRYRFIQVNEAGQAKISAAIEYRDNDEVVLVQAIYCEPGSRRRGYAGKAGMRRQRGDIIDFWSTPVSQGEQRGSNPSGETIPPAGCSPVK